MRIGIARGLNKKTNEHVICIISESWELGLFMTFALFSRKKIIKKLVYEIPVTIF